MNRSSCVSGGGAHIAFLAYFVLNSEIKFHREKREKITDPACRCAARFLSAKYVYCVHFGWTNFRCTHLLVESVVSTSLRTALRTVHCAQLRCNLFNIISSSAGTMGFGLSASQIRSVPNKNQMERLLLSPSRCVADVCTIFSVIHFSIWKGIHVPLIIHTN